MYWMDSPACSVTPGRRQLPGRDRTGRCHAHSDSGSLQALVSDTQLKRRALSVSDTGVKRSAVVVPEKKLIDFKVVPSSR